MDIKEINLERYKNVKMKEESIRNFVNVNKSLDPVFEFHGSNNQKISMYRSSPLHMHLIRAFNEMADISMETGKLVYLVDVDDMIKKECNDYYYGKRMEIAEKLSRVKSKQNKNFPEIKGKHLENKRAITWR